jgi:murein DD-endopeptidase MepM/ murein hydrolase activator NlpD
MRSGGTGGTIKHKGLYSASGTNNVVARCNTSQSWVVLYTGAGNGPLTAAFNAANNGAQKYCTFVAAPKALPIFDNPFRTATPSGYLHVTGFDFARAPYGTLKPSDYGQTGTTAATIVDWLGRAKPNYMDDHDGTDMLVARNTKIYALAAGKVIMARDYLSPCGPGDPVGSDSVAQKEVAIEHTVYAPNTSYYEKFVTYYAHFSSYLVKVNDVVAKGQQIGSAGSTGCSDGVHLHLGVYRTTNTASHLTEALAFNTKKDPEPGAHNNGRAYLTDPWGFAAPKGFDPWAWKAYPKGALSINLWNANQAPSRGNW